MWLIVSFVRRVSAKSESSVLALGFRDSMGVARSVGSESRAAHHGEDDVKCW